MTSKTRSALTTEQDTNFADNTTGAITPAILRSTVQDMIDSMVVQADLNAISVTSSANTTTGTQTVQGNSVYPFNSISITDSTINTTSGVFSDALLINYSFGGSSSQGGHQGIDVFSALTSATSGSNTNKQYVGGRFVGISTVNDGGTNTGAGALGAIFGINPVGTLGSLASNFAAVGAMEANVGIATGGSAKYKYGISIVQAGGDAVQGATYDTALAISNQGGTPNWNDGILFGDMNGQWPLVSTASMLGTTGASRAAGFGVNLTGVNFGTAAFKANAVGTGAFAVFTNSGDSTTLFQVDNAGNVFTKSQLQIGGASSGIVTQAAQSTAGSPTIVWGNTSGTPAVTASYPLAISTTTGNATIAAPALLRFALTGVNFNNANTDNAISITLPAGISRYAVNSVRISNASASISTATIGVFTATGGGGQTIAAAQAITVTATGADANNNTMLLTLTNSATEAYNDATLQIRVVNAQGSAATADVIIVIAPLT